MGSRKSRLSRGNFPLSSSSLRIKPIHPEKYYLEARINSGDRIVFRIEKGTIFFVDVVHHDDISRYGKRPKR